MNQLFIKESMLPCFRDKQVTGLIRLISGDNIIPTKRYSKIGFDGDILYVSEPGSLIDEGDSKIWVRSDGTAVRMSKNISTEVMWSQGQQSATALITEVDAKGMPAWASRYWLKILSVSTPIRVQELTDAQIESLGIIKKSDTEFIWGDDRLTTSPDAEYSDAFQYLWDLYYGNWRKERRSVDGAAPRFVSYPYDESIPRPNGLVVKSGGYEYAEYSNPFVTFYEVEQLDQAQV